MVFQPIWDLAAERLLGLEALMRPDTGLRTVEPGGGLRPRRADRPRPRPRRPVRGTRPARRAATSPTARCCSSTSRRRRSTSTPTADGWLLDAVTRAGIAPDRIVLEVTERFGARTDVGGRQPAAPARRGLPLALDDVGTGNSGLEMLQQVNADFVKIDRSIVVAATDRPQRPRGPDGDGHLRPTDRLLRDRRGHRGRRRRSTSSASIDDRDVHPAGSSRADRASDSDAPHPTAPATSRQTF